MIKPGTLIRVLYPDYAAGLNGVVEGREKNGRWIVRLKKNPSETTREPLWLSLDESDFEVLETLDSNP